MGHCSGAGGCYSAEASVNFEPCMLALQNCCFRTFCAFVLVISYKVACL